MIYIFIIKLTIEEQVQVDQNDIVITAKEYVFDSIWGDGIKVLLENNSDKDMMVSCNSLIVNDYMMTDLFVSEIAAGKKTKDTIYLSNSELDAGTELYDVNTYNTIQDSDPIVFSAH